ETGSDADTESEELPVEVLGHLPGVGPESGELPLGLVEFTLQLGGIPNDGDADLALSHQPSSQGIESAPYSAISARRCITANMASTYSSGSSTRTETGIPESIANAARA